MKLRISVLILGFLISQLHAQQVDTMQNDRFSMHVQTTVINQFKPAFKAKYSGQNSLLTTKENATSITSTFYAGMRLWKGADIYVNPEIAGGTGLSTVLGLGAATNGETFRIGDPAPQIYMARLFYRQIFSLTDEMIYQPTNLDQVGEHVPTKYIALTVGKMGAADFFDNNKFSHDPRTQFMSWALMDNGAWDYPANTRGYTPSAVLEYVSPQNELRYSLCLVPLEANGNEMNWKINKASSQTLEFTHRYQINKLDGAVRILGFYTSANMGNYKQSLALSSINPVIENTRKYGHTKYGFGISAEQNLTRDLGCFLRASWNDGQNETWVFTEIDHTISGGLSLNGQGWSRAADNIGLATVASGISKAHQDYLKAGGKGFILGDGNLNYGIEHLTELYYSADLYEQRIFLTGAYQLIVNPGYNKDREGPVHVLSVRLHASM